MPYFDFNNIRLAYDDVGSGRAVIQLHGYPFNRSLWNEQAGVIGKSYRVLAPDLRGHGDSDVAAGPAAMDLMARDVAALMNELQIEHAVIGGLSMGGYVALAFYRLFPERVDALILADTRAQADTEEGKNLRAKQAVQILAEGMAGIADAMLPKLLHPETVSKRPELVRRVRDMILYTKPAGAAAALQGMAARDDQTQLLEQISVPSLIIVGRDDAITPVADAEMMNQKIKGSRLVVLEAAGHVSNMEAAEEFNRAVLDFLATV